MSRAARDQFSPSRDSAYEISAVLSKMTTQRLRSVLHATGGSPAAPVTPFTAKVFVSSVGDVPYRLLSPPPGTAHAALVIVLHGSGQIGVDNLAQMGPFAKSWADPEIAARFPGVRADPGAQRNRRTGR